MKPIFETSIIIENTIEYYFDFKIRYNKLIFQIPDKNLLLSRVNPIIKLIIGNDLYFNNTQNSYYKLLVKSEKYSLNDATLYKISYESIKKTNKYLFEINVNDIINIIKDNKFYNNKYYYLYFVKKQNKLYLYIHDIDFLIVYEFIGNKFIFIKKYKCHRDFLLDDNDNLFCMYEYDIMPVSKQFKYYNYIIHFAKKLGGCMFHSGDIQNLFNISRYVYYELFNNSNKIELSIKYMLNFDFYRYANKIELDYNCKICKKLFII